MGNLSRILQVQFQLNYPHLLVPLNVTCRLCADIKLIVLEHMKIAADGNFDAFDNLRYVFYIL